jgi:EAL domain-containing protein (putative c-di-GMP-specific phosphodiesterase class I)
VIVAGIVRMCEALGITLLAEGVETQAELCALREIGIRYVQGYLLARPGLELPTVSLAAPSHRCVASA